MISLDEHLEQVRRRKKELGIEENDDLRNRGHARTPEKKELLRRMTQRAIHNGKAPVPCYIDGQLVSEETRNERNVTGNDITEPS